MLNRFFNKLGLGKKDAASSNPDPNDLKFDIAADSPRMPIRPKSILPEELKIGTTMRALPEHLPTPPRAWNVVLQKTELDSFWVQRVPTEAEPVPCAKGETLTLVTFDENHQRTYECVILKIKPGAPEQIQLAPPGKVQEEQSKASGMGSRRHYRVAVRLPAEVRISQHTSPISCHTRDVSLGGIAIDLSRNIDEGLELDLRIMSWNFPLQCKVRVVRCYEEDGVHVAALGFLPDLSPIAKDLIGHFIVEHQRGR